MPSKRKKAVGYVRVSTPVQVENGLGLEGQADQIRSYANAHNMDLVGIYEDGGLSAHGRHSSRRPGLRQAIAQAVAENIPLVVVSIDRLSRSLRDLPLLTTPGLTIISIKEGRVGRKRLRTLVEAAEAQSAEGSLRARAGAAKGKSAGRKPGNRTNLPDAQRQGAIANVLRAQQRINDLADYIAANPGIMGLTWKDRTAMLNAAGHHNLKSATHGPSR